jgi:hypothetical protein
MKTWQIFLLLVTFFSYSCFAQAENDTTILEMEKQLERLNKVNFHPNLLPIILRNSDFMGLTTEQVTAFRTWGKMNFKPMVAVMNEVIRKRIEFEEAALSQSVSADSLRVKQEEIFQLHRKLLDYKLSCRENIIQTFNEENWEGFMMVLGEEGFPIPGQMATTEFASFPVTSEVDGSELKSQPSQ